MKIAVLASGGGTNFQSLIDNVKSGYIPGSEIIVLLTNKPETGAIKHAEDAGIDTLVLDSGDYESREKYDAELVSALKKYEPDLICLAGWMRILSPTFVDAFPSRIMNIHPSLLPAFGGGTHAQADAFNHGVKISGCTVHFVTNDVDTGPIIIQAAVPVQEDDTAETLQKRILKQEHKAYPKAVKLFVEGKLSIEGRKVKIKEDSGSLLTAEP